MGNFARIDRIAQQVQREIAELVRLEINDPRVRLVTITGVEVAGDYSHAKVFFTRLDGKHAEAQQGLESASGFLRKRLAHSLKLRIMPQLHFVYDASVERGSHLSQLIDQAVASDRHHEEKKQSQ
ncbi:MAG: ribosome-binding factor A [Gallionellales bacterium RIFCSPLOWO2_12_FULL_59_22]|nr:MAG: ribosome-binding factor A [Gallionellales bacterium RIFCSPLOWO2_02_FULL_59_110]OGT14769.1 MAG: ribosome-binding factor A [Gallionellales bacterium RIFCSPLOWO2_12_FULL_59_22]